MPHPLRVVHNTDPAQDIRDDVQGFIASIQPLGAQVLLVMYERGKQKGGGDTMTAGGIIVPITAQGIMAEDHWQGKVGLVMAMGPIAFKDDTSHQFGGVTPKVGDWVMINIGDTYSFDLPGERRARMTDDVNVKAIVSPNHFDVVW